MCENAGVETMRFRVGALRDRPGAAVKKLAGEKEWT
jgi:hypothetical protein